MSWLTLSCQSIGAENNERERTRIPKRGVSDAEQTIFVRIAILDPARRIHI
jgi:hypothetical protein